MKREIIAQMPPLGGGPLGMEGAPPGGEMGPPGDPTTSERPEISGPLKSIGEILYDFNTEEYIALHPDKTEEDIAMQIWTDYGGDIDGVGAESGKTGSRTEKDLKKSPEETKKERLETEDSKWERLEKGKNISEFTSLGELTGLMESMVFGMIKKYKAPAGGAPGGGGGLGMPPLASSNIHMNREAFIKELKEDLEKLRASK